MFGDPEWPWHSSTYGKYSPIRNPRRRCVATVIRLAWMMFGNTPLLPCAAFLAQDQSRAVINTFLAAVRHSDIPRTKDQTSEGKPATLDDWRRHAAMTALVSLAP